MSEFPLLVRFLSPLILSSSISLSDALNDIDQFVGHSPLELSFPAHQQATLVSESCASSHRCSSFNFVSLVTDSGPDRVVVEDRGSDGKPFGRSTLTQEKWREWNGNLVRGLIAATESYGFVVSLESIVSNQAEVEIDQATRVVDTRILRINGVNRMGMKTHLAFEVCGQCGGLGQILTRERRNNGSSTDRSTIKILSSLPLSH